MDSSAPFIVGGIKQHIEFGPSDFVATAGFVSIVRIDETEGKPDGSREHIWSCKNVNEGRLQVMTTAGDHQVEYDQVEHGTVQQVSCVNPDDSTANLFGDYSISPNQSGVCCHCLTSESPCSSCRHNDAFIGSPNQSGVCCRCLTSESP